MTNNAMDYAKAVWDEYEGVFKDPTTLAEVATPPPVEARGKVTVRISDNHVMWKRLIKLATGQKGPFATGGRQRASEHSKLRHRYFFSTILVTFKLNVVSS